MKTYRTLITLSLAAITALGAFSQTTDVTVLEPFTVHASPLGELQFGSDGKSAFGDSGTFVNTPRSVSTVDNTVLTQFGLSNVTQLAAFTSNVQSVGSFGDFVSVNVRGDLAEQFVNGQRRTHNTFGFQPSLNGVESVDVVHGAPSVVFGPGFFGGGYTNLLTKTAQPVDFTNVNVTLGTLTPAGNSFLNTIYQLDVNRPLSKTDAFRISYQGQNNDTFYHRNGGKQDSQDLFMTWARRTADTSLDVVFEWNHQNAPEQIGVNRVTQTLIDHNLYRSGTIDLPFDTTAVPNGRLVNLDPTTTLMSKGDKALADQLFGQVMFVKRVSDTFSVKNYTLAEYVDRGRDAAYGYWEYARQTTFDNRTELHFDTKHVYTIVGVNLRYEDRKVMVNYLNTYFNAFDVSTGLPNVASEYTDFFIPGYVGMGGKEFFGPTDWTFDTSHSTVYQAAPFLQQRYTFGKIQLLYGVRADRYKATVRDPIQQIASDDVTTTSASHTESIVFNVTNDLSFYATFGRMQAVNASVTGGAIVFDPDYTVNPKSFHSMNTLYEIGARYQKSKTTVGLTGFWQERQQHNFYTTQPDDICVRGVELEVKAQLTPRFYSITNVTYMEANTVNSFPYEFNTAELPAASEPGDYRLPGLSRIYFNQTLSYQLENGFGVAVTGLYQTKQSGNALGGYHIPAQHSINAQISYTAKSWRIALNVTNVTNQRNWIHNGDFYGDNVVISRELPINANLTVSKRF